MNLNLPALPALDATTERVQVWGLMQDYAKQAVIDERERIAKMCEAMRINPPAECDDVERGFNAALRRVAEAIRSVTPTI